MPQGFLRREVFQLDGGLWQHRPLHELANVLHMWRQLVDRAEHSIADDVISQAEHPGDHSRAGVPCHRQQEA
jgi:hypothetical protein